MARTAAAPHRRGRPGTSAAVDRRRGRGWKQGERRPSARRSTPTAGGRPSPSCAPPPRSRRERFHSWPVAPAPWRRGRPTGRPHIIDDLPGS